MQHIRVNCILILIASETLFYSKQNASLLSKTTLRNCKFFVCLQMESTDMEKKEENIAVAAAMVATIVMAVFAIILK